MKYRPEIDGLRAVAVLPVMLYHAGFGAFSGGYVGVDVFFVISGYLITSILLADLEGHKFSIARFYERRARRILPVLFFVIAVSYLLAWHFMPPFQLKEFSGSVLAVVAFVSNVAFWRNTDYFASAADQNPLLHTWSLSVEEQFYLFFPLLIYVVWKIGKRLGTGSSVAFFSLLVAFSLALSEWASRAMPVANFYLLPFRAWELGVGVLCAYCLQNRDTIHSNTLSLIGLGLISFSVFFFDSSTPFPSLFAVAPVAGTALVVLFAAPGTWIARMLSLRGFVAVGLLSYSAYLWHQPLMAFARVRDLADHPPAPVMGALVLLSLLLAAFSWRFIEQPFRKPQAKVLQSRFGILALSVLGAGALAGGALTARATDGFYDQWAARHPKSVSTLKVIERSLETKRARLSDDECRFNVAILSPKVIEQLKRCHTSGGPGILVFGDSHSIDLHNGVILNKVYADRFVLGLSSSGCRLHEPQSHCQSELIRLLSEQPTLFEKVFYIQAGFHLLQTKEGKVGRPIVSGVPMESAIDMNDYRVVDSSVTKVVEYLDALSKFTDVTWIGPRVEPHLSISLLLQRGCDNSFTLRPGQAGLYRALDNTIAKQSDGRDFRYVSLQQVVKFDMTNDFINCKSWYWRDSDHWSMDGARLFVGRLTVHGVFR